jgi:predicted O-methyltransferase YrrM
MDPFMGAGSTALAAIKNGRKFIGIEIDHNYYEIAKRRICEALIQPALDMPVADGVQQLTIEAEGQEMIKEDE